MHSHIAAAGQRLETELIQESNRLSGSSPERQRHRNRLRLIATSLVDKLEGETIRDALTVLYMAGEIILTQSRTKALPPAPGAATNKETE